MGIVAAFYDPGERNEAGKTLDLCIDSAGGDALRDGMCFQQSAGDGSVARRHLVQQPSKTVRQPGLVCKECRQVRRCKYRKLT
jgi:hypothetical protein